MRQFPALGQEVAELTGERLKRRLDDGERITLLDTRRPEDVAEWRIEHDNLELVNVPFTAFLDGDRPVETVPDGVPDGHLVTCCAKGLSSRFVAEVLAREGRSVEALADGMEGWARLYELVPLDVDGPVDVYQYHRISSGCLAYLLVAGEEAAVVDPLRAFAGRYADDAAARGARLRYAIDTHVHADHVSGLRAVASLAGTEAVLPAGARDRGLAFDARLVDDGETLPLGAAELSVVALPGHTTEMIGVRAGGVLVSGDTVFCSSVARPDLEDGDADAARAAAGRLHDTLGDLAAMDPTIRLAPGHTTPREEPGDDGSYTAPLGELVDTLSAFEMSRPAFVEYATADLPPQPRDYERIIETNLGRERIDDETAFELELGPNNCAAE